MYVYTYIYIYIYIHTLIMLIIMLIVYDIIIRLYNYGCLRKLFQYMKQTFILN